MHLTLDTFAVEQVLDLLHAVACTVGVEDDSDRFAIRLLHLDLSFADELEAAKESFSTGRIFGVIIEQTDVGAWSACGRSLLLLLLSQGGAH